VPWNQFVRMFPTDWGLRMYRSSLLLSRNTPNEAEGGQR
jgi:hypothetical protein